MVLPARPVAVDGEELPRTAAEVIRVLKRTARPMEVKFLPPSTDGLLDLGGGILASGGFYVAKYREGWSSVVVVRTHQAPSPFLCVENKRGVEKGEPHTKPGAGGHCKRNTHKRQIPQGRRLL